MARWRAEETESGFDLTRDGRGIAYDLDDLDVVRAQVRRKDGKGTDIVVTELDGYRRVIKA